MACHVWTNGSLVWLIVKGGAVWLPQVPTVTTNCLTEGGASSPQ